MTKVACTMIGPSALGRMCPKRILPDRAPLARAASMYSRSRMLNAWPRTRRAMSIQAVAEMAIMMLASPLSEHEVQDHRDQHARDAVEDVDEQADDVVDPAPEVAGDQSDHDPDRQNDRRGADADDQRDLGALHQPAQKVPSEVVGAEQVLRRRREIGERVGQDRRGVDKGSRRSR